MAGDLLRRVVGCAQLRKTARPLSRDSILGPGAGHASALLGDFIFVWDFLEQVASYDNSKFRQTRLDRVPAYPAGVCLHVIFGAIALMPFIVKPISSTIFYWFLALLRYGAQQSRPHWSSPQRPEGKESKAWQERFFIAGKGTYYSSRLYGLFHRHSAHSCLLSECRVPGAPS